MLLVLHQIAALTGVSKTHSWMVLNRVLQLFHQIAALRQLQSHLGVATILSHSCIVIMKTGARSHLGVALTRQHGHEDGLTLLRLVRQDVNH